MDEMADQYVRKVEQAKGRIFKTPGECCNFDNQLKGIMDKMPGFNVDCDYVHSAMVDENYIMLRSHVDSITREKIVKGEYIDFAKLLPRDKIMNDEPQRMEMVTKDGHIYWTPAIDNQKIFNFARWEQSFRIYSNVYCQAYPQRSSELLQYNHLIHTASLSFVWDNVYKYNIDFRLHMSRFPRRSWSIILQQAWSVHLKDRLKRFGNNESNRNQKGSSSQHKTLDDGWGNICKRFNKGKCTFGVGCKFEHRCKYCKKFGHGMHICRKLKVDCANANKVEQNPVQETTKANKEAGDK